MTFEEVVKGIDHHQWTSEPDVAELIATLIKMHAFKDAVEIGVFKGLTSSYIINSLPEDGTYRGIDMMDHRAETVKQYMQQKKHTFLLGDSKAELKKLTSNSADIIFLDGDHSLPYVKAEFLESLRIIRKGGIICIHDYNTHGVKTWTDFIQKKKNFSAIVFDTSEGRGMSVVVCHRPEKRISAISDLWFDFTRSDFAFKVRDKLKSIWRNMTGKKTQ